MEEQVEIKDGKRKTNLKKVFVLTPFESHPIINFAYKTIPCNRRHC